MQKQQMVIQGLTPAGVDSIDINAGARVASRQMVGGCNASGIRGANRVSIICSPHSVAGLCRSHIRDPVISEASSMEITLTHSASGCGLTLFCSAR